jgi:hypothetical protein
VGERDQQRPRPRGRICGDHREQPGPRLLGVAGLGEELRLDPAQCGPGAWLGPLRSRGALAGLAREAGEPGARTRGGERAANRRRGDERLVARAIHGPGLDHRARAGRQPGRARLYRGPGRTQLLLAQREGRFGLLHADAGERAGPPPIQQGHGFRPRQALPAADPGRELLGSDEVSAADQLAHGFMGHLVERPPGDHLERALRGAGGVQRQPQRVPLVLRGEGAVDPRAVAHGRGVGAVERLPPEGIRRDLFARVSGEVEELRRHAHSARLTAPPCAHLAA